MTRKTINIPEAPRPIGPYSQAVEARGLVFVSGQIPIDPATGTVVRTDIRSQTGLVLENAKAVLAGAGCRMEHVVKTTIYIRNMADFEPVNDVYARYFQTDPPARAVVEVSRLPKDVSIEMEFVACVPAGCPVNQRP